MRSLTLPTSITKRDGRLVPFEIGRIESALLRCFAALGRTPSVPIPELSRRVVNLIAARLDDDTPTVEDVQDATERILQAAGEFDAAKAYILYRAKHTEQRAEREVPQDVRDAFAESATYFPTPLQQFQFFDKYSRYNPTLGRRETWVETVDRSVDYLYELSGGVLDPSHYERIRRGILEMKVMPSMRLLSMAGAPARRNNLTIYNCSYVPVDSVDAFAEALLISMSGCGVGFSVRRQRPHPHSDGRAVRSRHDFAHSI